jgi:hypothetical protein
VLVLVGGKIMVFGDVLGGGGASWIIWAPALSMSCGSEDCCSEESRETLVSLVNLVSLAPPTTNSLLSSPFAASLSTFSINLHLIFIDLDPAPIDLTIIITQTTMLR